MPIAFVQAGTVQSSTGFGTVVTLSAPVVSGHTILLAILWDGNDDSTTFPTATDDLGNSYAIVKVFVRSRPPNSSLTSLVLMAAPVTHAGTPTISIHFASAARAAGLPLEYSGLNNSGLLDQFSGVDANTGTTLSTSATPTTTQSDELLLAIAGAIGSSTTMSAGSGYTMRAQGATTSLAGQLAVQDKIVSSTGAYSADISGMPNGASNTLLLTTLKAVVASNTANNVSVNLLY
jgi:hypothetical protein